MAEHEEVLKNILVKEGGNWREFITPVHKKLLPSLVPSGVLGFIFYNVIDFFMKGEFAYSFKGKLFVTAMIFVYFWFVILFFLLSSLVYTILDVRQRIGDKGAITERLDVKKA